MKFEANAKKTKRNSSGEGQCHTVYKDVEDTQNDTVTSNKTDRILTVSETSRQDHVRHEISEVDASNPSDSSWSLHQPTAQDNSDSPVRKQHRDNFHIKATVSLSSTYAKSYSAPIL